MSTALCAATWSALAVVTGGERRHTQTMCHLWSIKMKLKYMPKSSVKFPGQHRAYLWEGRKDQEGGAQRAIAKPRSVLFLDPGGSSMGNPFVTLTQVAVAWAIHF